MNEPYPPLLAVPDGLSDEAAAKLLEFLYELAGAFENHYASQLHRYYAAPDDEQLGLWDDTTDPHDDGPPF